MRKLIPLLLLFILLCGCTEQAQPASDAEFWYLRSDYQYGPKASMFVPVAPSANMDDVASALTVYLQGPAAPELRSPFPANTQLVSYYAEDGIASVTVTDAFANAAPAAVNCAAICLTNTVISLSECHTVRIYTESTPQVPYLQLTAQDFAVYDDIITDVITSPESEVPQ